MSIAGAGAAPALTGALSGWLGGVGPALSAVGLSYAAAALIVLIALPETKGLGSGGGLESLVAAPAVETTSE